MRGKFIFVVGLATGYVLGTRAGRERYEQIKAGAEKVWNIPAVQSGVQSVQSFAGSRVDQVKADLSQKARNALGALIGREPLSSPQPARSGSTKAAATRSATTTKSAPKTAPKKTAAKPAAAKPAASKPAASAASESDE